jgi:uncharacterized protein YndB with AHSA1/START domain
MAVVSTDRIENTILLRAPTSRVWQALADSRQFGKWFGVDVDAAFVPGARIQGKVLTKGYEHLTWDVTIEQMVPEKLLSWRWHPGAVDPLDYANEPTTLVTFTLEDVEGGTKLTIVESGFDRIPPERRMQAFRDNEGGWAAQIQSVANYVHATA